MIIYSKIAITAPIDIYFTFSLPSRPAIRNTPPKQQITDTMFLRFRSLSSAEKKNPIIGISISIMHMIASDTTEPFISDVTLKRRITILNGDFIVTRPSSLKRTS